MHDAQVPALAYVPAIGGSQSADEDAWLDVHCALVDHFHEPDVEAARAFYACLAAHDLAGQPVWPMLVAPPGSMKTELIKACGGLPNFHAIDSLTPNTFLSGRAPERGMPRGRDGLLQRIGTNPILASPDFSTLLEGNSDKRDAVFAQLRRLYDGEFRREVGIELGADATQWKGRLTFVAGVTPAIDNYQAVFSQLGERFAMIRWPRAAGAAAAIRAMEQDIAAKDTAMRDAVNALFDAMRFAPQPQLPTALRNAIAETADIVALARTAVVRDRNTRELESLPQPEGATRIAQQLCQLAKGSARLELRAFVDLDDIAVVHRVAFDTIPPVRAAVLRALASGKTHDCASRDGAAIPRTTRNRATDDLVVLGLIAEDRGEFTPEGLEMFRRAGLLTM
jgi:hypothetical protein